MQFTVSILKLTDQQYQQDSRYSHSNTKRPRAVGIQRIPSHAASPSTYLDASRKLFLPTSCLLQTQKEAHRIGVINSSLPREMHIIAPYLDKDSCRVAPCVPRGHTSARTANKETGRSARSSARPPLRRISPDPETDTNVI